MIKKPLALDLCCGLGGWTIGLQAAGWKVIGFDIEAWEEYPGKLVLKDVREVSGQDYLSVLLVVASPPCQEFSYRDLPFGRVKKLPPPDKSIWFACERIARECDAPLVLENVRGAQRWMGKAKARYGSLYLWGDVPALLPHGKHVKGFEHNFQGRTQSKRGPRAFSFGSKKRKQWSAQSAKIPLKLSQHIGLYFYPEKRK